VQGLTWYATNLWINDNGDVVQKFVEEVLSKIKSGFNNKSSILGFETILHMKPIKLLKVVCTYKMTMYINLLSFLKISFDMKDTYVIMIIIAFVFVY
jgi:hypothetical protein